MTRRQTLHEFVETNHHLDLINDRQYYQNDTSSDSAIDSTITTHQLSCSHIIDETLSGTIFSGSQCAGVIVDGRPVTPIDSNAPVVNFYEIDHPAGVVRLYWDRPPGAVRLVCDYEYEYFEQLMSDIQWVQTYGQQKKKVDWNKEGF